MTAIIALCSSYTSSPSQSATAWASVLYLATKWDFSSIRELAIASFTPSASDVDKVVLGHRFGHQEWLLPGYTGLCERDEPLTELEGERLGIKDVVAIAKVREDIRSLQSIASPAITMTQSLRCMGNHTNTYTFNSSQTSMKCLSCSYNVSLPNVDGPAQRALPPTETISKRIEVLIPRSTIWYVKLSLFEPIMRKLTLYQHLPPRFVGKSSWRKWKRWEIEVQYRVGEWLGRRIQRGWNFMGRKCRPE